VEVVVVEVLLPVVLEVDVAVPVVPLAVVDVDVVVVEEPVVPLAVVDVDVVVVEEAADATPKAGPDCSPEEIGLLQGSFTH